MNCKMIPIKLRTVTWRVINRAYKLGTHSGETYPYKDCKICGEQVASVSHRYFECPKSAAIWRRIQEEIWAPRKLLVTLGKDVFFNKAIQEAPPMLRVIYYHLALNQIHIARRTFVLEQTPINVELTTNRWKEAVSKTLLRISKYGDLIPGNKADQDTILASSKYIGVDTLSHRIFSQWWSDMRPAQDLKIWSNYIPGQVVRCPPKYFQIKKEKNS
ncbi:hypothetical protein DSO57_1031090 [Entomophthora muscae]|uniref:Uncharacterized protein n=1 Tax=Entomophthora muscae TaxID=34485 RepID=A0ACC2UMF1_9FUNG|nr:hypothetical protein DSO57_1031090 [Entomophthora muscae]